MENNNEFRRLQAENIGLKLKVKDLEAILKRKQERFDTLYDSYIGIKLCFDRARGLLSDYALIPGNNGMAKLDRKLGLFFPEILKNVKENRERKSRLTTVEGSIFKESRDGA